MEGGVCQAEGLNNSILEEEEQFLSQFSMSHVKERKKSKVELFTARVLTALSA